MKKFKKIYLAGPLFTEWEIKARNEEARKLREMGYKVFNPIEINNKNYNANEIFQRDYKAIKNCDVMIACIDGWDSGTMAEIGIAFQLKKDIIGHYSNWKYWKGSKEEFNLFIKGCISILLDSFDKIKLEWYFQDK